MQASSRGKGELVVKQQATQAASSELTRASDEKQLVEFAISKEFKALRDGEVEGQEAKAFYVKLEAVAERVGIEQALMKAVETSILKLPKERGSFDAMVLAQLQEGLQKRLNDLEQQRFGEKERGRKRIPR